MAVARAAALLLAEEPPALAALAATVGYAPHHFHRLFRRATGLTPAAFARAARAHRAEAALDQAATVTGAIHAAGYSGPSRFYAGAAARMGMPPRHRAGGGAGEAIDWTLAPTSLGPLLIAATARGPCRIAFAEDGAALAARFPHARLTRDGGGLPARAAAAVAQAEQVVAAGMLDDAARDTAFREAVRRALAPVVPHGDG